MCDQSTYDYVDGDVVWTKLGRYWWPGKVCSQSKLPEEIKDSSGKKPIAVVKFFTEELYEFVKKRENINIFNCSRKNDFIRKGLDLFRSNDDYLKKFRADIQKAEELIHGDTDILSREEFAEGLKFDYSVLFSDSTSTPIKGKKNIETKKESHSKRMFTLNSRGKQSSLTRFGAIEQRRPEHRDQQSYKCFHCGQFFNRMNNLIMHTKTHTQIFKPQNDSTESNLSTLSTSDSVNKSPKIIETDSTPTKRNSSSEGEETDSGKQHPKRLRLTKEDLDNEPLTHFKMYVWRKRAEEIERNLIKKQLHNKHQKIVHGYIEHRMEKLKELRDIHTVRELYNTALERQLEMEKSESEVHPWELVKQKAEVYALEMQLQHVRQIYRKHSDAYEKQLRQELHMHTELASRRPICLTEDMAKEKEKQLIKEGLEYDKDALDGVQGVLSAHRIDEEHKMLNDEERLEIVSDEEQHEILNDVEQQNENIKIKQSKQGKNNQTEQITLIKKQQEEQSYQPILLKKQEGKQTDQGRLKPKQVKDNGNEEPELHLQTQINQKDMEPGELEMARSGNIVKQISNKTPVEMPKIELTPPKQDIRKQILDDWAEDDDEEEISLANAINNLSELDTVSNNNDADINKNQVEINQNTGSTIESTASQKSTDGYEMVANDSKPDSMYSSVRKISVPKYRNIPKKDRRDVVLKEFSNGEMSITTGITSSDILENIDKSNGKNVKSNSDTVLLDNSPASSSKEKNNSHNVLESSTEIPGSNNVSSSKLSTDCQKGAISCFDFQDEEDSSDTLSVLSKLKKKYLNANEIMEIGGELKLNENEADNELTENIEKFISSLSQSNLVEKVFKEVRALPPKERGKRIFKSRNKSKLGDVNFNISQTTDENSDNQAHSSSSIHSDDSTSTIDTSIPILKQNSDMASHSTSPSASPPKSIVESETIALTKEDSNNKLHQAEILATAHVLGQETENELTEEFTTMPSTSSKTTSINNEITAQVEDIENTSMAQKHQRVLQEVISEELSNPTISSNIDVFASSHVLTTNVHTSKLQNDLLLTQQDLSSQSEEQESPISKSTKSVTPTTETIVTTEETVVTSKSAEENKEKSISACESEMRNISRDDEIAQKENELAIAEALISIPKKLTALSNNPLKMSNLAIAESVLENQELISKPALQGSPQKIGDSSNRNIDICVVASTPISAASVDAASKENKTCETSVDSTNDTAVVRNFVVHDHFLEYAVTTSSGTKLTRSTAKLSAVNIEALGAYHNLDNIPKRRPTTSSQSRTGKAKRTKNIKNPSIVRTANVGNMSDSNSDGNGGGGNDIVTSATELMTTKPWTSRVKKPNISGRGRKRFSQIGDNGASNSSTKRTRNTSQNEADTVSTVVSSNSRAQDYTSTNNTANIALENIVETSCAINSSDEVSRRNRPQSSWQSVIEDVDINSKPDATVSSSTGSEPIMSLKCATQRSTSSRKRKPSRDSAIMSSDEEDDDDEDDEDNDNNDNDDDDDDDDDNNGGGNTGGGNKGNNGRNDNRNIDYNSDSDSNGSRSINTNRFGATSLSKNKSANERSDGKNRAHKKKTTPPHEPISVNSASSIASINTADIARGTEPVTTAAKDEAEICNTNNQILDIDSKVQIISSDDGTHVSASNLNNSIEQPFFMADRDESIQLSDDSHSGDHATLSLEKTAEIIKAPNNITTEQSEGNVEDIAVNCNATSSIVLNDSDDTATTKTNDLKKSTESMIPTDKTVTIMQDNMQIKECSSINKHYGKNEPDLNQVQISADISSAPTNDICSEKRSDSEFKTKNDLKLNLENVETLKSNAENLSLNTNTHITEEAEISNLKSTRKSELCTDLENSNVKMQLVNAIVESVDKDQATSLSKSEENAPDKLTYFSTANTNAIPLRNIEISEMKLLENTSHDGIRSNITEKVSVMSDSVTKSDSVDAITTEGIIIGDEVEKCTFERTSPSVTKATPVLEENISKKSPAAKLSLKRHMNAGIDGAFEPKSSRTNIAQSNYSSSTLEKMTITSTKEDFHIIPKPDVVSNKLNDNIVDNWNAIKENSQDNTESQGDKPALTYKSGEKLVCESIVINEIRNDLDKSPIFVVNAGTLIDPGIGGNIVITSKGNVYAQPSSYLIGSEKINDNRKVYETNNLNEVKLTNLTNEKLKTLAAHSSKEIKKGGNIDSCDHSANKTDNDSNIGSDSNSTSIVTGKSVTNVSIEENIKRNNSASIAVDISARQETILSSQNFVPYATVTLVEDKSTKQVVENSINTPSDKDTDKTMSFANVKVNEKIIKAGDIKQMIKKTPSVPFKAKLIVGDSSNSDESIGVIEEYQVTEKINISKKEVILGHSKEKVAISQSNIETVEVSEAVIGSADSTSGTVMKQVQEGVTIKTPSSTSSSGKKCSFSTDLSAKYGDNNLMAIAGEPFGGPANSFYLCATDGNDGGILRMYNQPLYLNAANQLVPMSLDGDSESAEKITASGIDSPATVQQSEEQDHIQVTLQANEPIVSRMTQLNEDSNAIIVIDTEDRQQIMLNTQALSALIESGEGPLLTLPDGRQLLFPPELFRNSPSNEMSHMLNNGSTNPDIIAAALANTEIYPQEQIIADVLQIETNNGVQIVDQGIAFKQIKQPVTAETNETNAILTQPPIMSTLEVPSSNKKSQIEQLAVNTSSETGLIGQNLDDSLAVIGVTAQQSIVPSSLELPITVTNPAIAAKTSSNPIALAGIYTTTGLTQPSQVSPVKSNLNNDDKNDVNCGPCVPPSVSASVSSISSAVVAPTLTRFVAAPLSSSIKVNEDIVTANTINVNIGANRRFQIKGLGNGNNSKSSIITDSGVTVKNVQIGTEKTVLITKKNTKETNSSVGIILTETTVPTTKMAATKIVKFTPGSKITAPSAVAKTISAPNTGIIEIPRLVAASKTKEMNTTAIQRFTSKNTSEAQPSLFSSQKSLPSLPLQPPTATKTSNPINSNANANINTNANIISTTNVSDNVHTTSNSASNQSNERYNQSSTDKTISHQDQHQNDSVR